MKKHSHTYFLILFVILMLGITACEDFTTVDPPRTEIVRSEVFSSDAAAQSAISGIYSLMMSNPSLTNAATEQYTGLSSDELINYTTATDAERQFYVNALSPLNDNIQGKLWTEGYKYLFNINSLLEGLDKSAAISENVKKQLRGEALFLRAFCNFYLTNMFGDIPLVLTTDYRINSSIPRSSSTVVYQQIISDLVAAQPLLPQDFSFTSAERIRATKWAAIALLARAYLYNGNWSSSEEQASLVLNNTTLFSLVPEPNNVFLKNSLESIWQLKPVIPSFNTTQASIFILDAAPSSQSFNLTDGLVTSFEVGDKRRAQWISSVTSAGKTYFFSYKYKKRTDPAVTEYATVLRLAELYLVRAEARAQLSNISGSLSDLNRIRTRAALANRVTFDKSQLLLFIESERRAELFTEWGHRWFDLKRTGRATAVLQPLKTNWSDSDVLYPIPQSELLLDPAMLPQNPGY